MKKKSLSVIGKIFTSVILTCYSFAPSVMAIDDIITTDNSQDILDVGISDPTWITNGNSSTTFNVVTVGETYVAPQNSEVTVTFSKLPTNPSTLSITEITLTDEEVAATGAVSNKAYDIDTSMMDGTFEYDLTLPSSSDDTKIVYAENRGDLLNNVQEVGNTVVDNGASVEIQGLNHFTIFIVTTSGNAPTVSAGTVNNATSVTVTSGTSITVKLNVTMNGGENWKSTGYQIGSGTWQCANTTDHSGNGTYNDSFVITAPSIDGTYNLNLKAYSKSSCSTSGGSVSTQYSMPNAIVVDNSITPPVLVDNPSDKYAMTSVTGIWTSISGGSGYTGLNTNEIRWGSPSGDTKSGLKFTNSGTQSFNEGNTFYLGMLTHMNWGTIAGTAATGATLQITLDFNRPNIANQVLAYDFSIEETSNGYNLYYCPAYQISDTPCDDKVTFPNSYGTQVFVIDDVQYTLVIDGFVSEYPSGSALSAFITEEQKDNSAFLVGHLSSVLVERPAISIIKKTNNQDIATAPGNNLYVGDTVTWQYIVQNTGNTALSNITVTDNPAETITCPSTSLASGASMTCTASGTVMAGQFTNTATVRSGSLSASDTSYYNGISRSHLIVQKTTLPAGDATLFNINATASTGTIFGAETGTISDSTDKDYSVSAGTYSVTESVPAGWGQTSNTCTNVVVGINDTKTCTIVNQKLPTLTIEKVLLGDSTPLSNFSYKLDGGTAVPFEVDGSNTIFVVPGSNYAITEANPGSSFNVTYSSGCNGNLTYGQSATCTITNTKYATLTIVKDANPNSTQTFAFNTSGTGLADFSLTDDGSVFGSNTRTFTNLLPATYSVAENAVSGWDSTSSCTDGSLNTAINISAGESVTCTFTNVMRGAIGGHKYNDADGDYATNDRTGVLGWTIELYKNGIKIAETTTDINGAYGFSNLVSGAYQLREALTIGSGWYKIYPTAEYLDVTLLPGENDFGNDFVNVKYPTITVLKNVDLNADGVIDITGATDWTWDINGNGDNLTGSTVSVNPGTYTISEDQKANYHVTDLTCGTTSYGAVESQSVTLTSGQDLSCTFTNTRDTGTLRVVKNVVNDNGGVLNVQDFSFVVDSGTPISFEADGSNDLTKYAGGITYNITEPAVAGYATTYNNCTDVTVPANGVATCTITNDDIAPTLTLVKTVTNDNGGTKAVSDFPLFIGTTQVTSGIASSLEANTEYTVSETNSAGYTASVWGGDCSSDGKITLLPGDAKACTITNDDVAPTLRLEKLVTNDDGGTKASADWTLYAQGSKLGFNDLGNSSTFHTVEAGITYNLSESATPTGYTSSWWTCTGGEASGNTVKLGVGENVTCTITNDDIAPTLMLIKNVVNDNGGNAVANDWDLTATGTDRGFTDKGDSTTAHTVKAGVEYTLTESNVAGYTPTNLSCTGGSLNGNKLTLGLDEDVVCTVTNTDAAPTLTVVKNVINDNGGDAAVTDFGIKLGDNPLSFDSGTTLGDTTTYTSTPSVTANASYTLTENDLTGYVEGAWSCTDNSTGSTLTFPMMLNEGQNVTCTIANNDIAPVLVLDKILVADNNGNETESYWTLSADGGNAGIISGQGASGHTDVVSDSTFKAGTYTLNENSAGAAYSSGPWTCVKNGSATVIGNTITLGVGDTAVCTITNDDVAPTLTVVKNVVNDNGGNAVIGDFDIKMNNSALSFDSGTTSGKTTTYTSTPTVLSNTSYTLSEADLAGYTEGNWSCVDYMTGAPLSNPLTLNEGQDAICTVTNDDVAPTITLTKAVVNDNGGEATANDFGLTIGGTSVTSGQTLNVNANEAITLDEAGLFGYSFVSITGDTKCPSVLGGTVTLNEGENVVCTITNNDIAPQLTVVKHVVNYTNDTNSVAGNFQMMVSGTNVSNPSFAGSEAGTTLTLNAGSYGVTETYNTSDYTQSIGDNCSGTIGIGESKTCTITNTDIDHLPSIEVNKTADDNDVPETGQNVTFTYTVKNTSSESVEITYLNDSVFGALDGNDTCKVGTTLAPDASCSFTLTKFISGDAGSADHENVFVAKAQDDETNTTEAQDNEIISFNNVNPDITVAKTASVASVPETGGDVLFTFTVQNNTAESVMITDLFDNKFGYLPGDADCHIATIIPGNSSCSFENTFHIDGVAPAVHTNVFTAIVIDDERNIDRDSASANVSLTYVPTLKLMKSVVNAYNSEGSASDWTLYATGDRYGFSAAGDEGTFHVVTPGQTYTLSEEGLSGFTASQWSCDKEGVLDGNTVTLAAEDDVTCTITNTALPGTITVYKNIVDADYTDEGVYSDSDFNVTLNGDLTDVKAISDTKDGKQTAIFSNLAAGSYSINELQKDGFLSLGCRVINERPSFMETGTFYVGNGENIEVVCTNQVIAPELQIAKANNAGGTGLVAGSNVLYTLIVTAPESQDDGGNYIIEDVKVVDLPPAGIKYQVGSWTAISNIRGNLKTLGITTEPTYASPGKWNLGEMLEGEVVTLTYVGNISDTLDAGKYKDLAWTEGVTLTDNRTLGRAATGFFASTNVNITEPVEQGQVLGITDEQTLPDTGASTVLTIGAVISMILGSIFLIFNPKKKMMKVLGLSVVALVGITSFAMPTKAYADSGDLAVEIEQPKTPYSESNFNIGFVALDIQSRSIAVQCYETTHGAFGPEYTLNTIGNSGNCVVDNSVITTDGTYEFYVVAKAGTDEVTSDKVSVVIDLAGPAPVLSYLKTVASCNNNLQFTTANDGQTTKVQIFRSDKATFTADSTTLIKEIVAGPNQLVTYSDTQPVCGQTYFYAVRALDVADNTSSFVTDKTVVVTIVPAVTPTTPVTPTVVPVEEIKGAETTEETTDNTDTNQNTNEEVKGVTDDETKSNVWSWLKYVLIGIGVLAIISITYVYTKDRKRGQEIK